MCKRESSFCSMQCSTVGSAKAIGTYFYICDRHRGTISIVILVIWRCTWCVLSFIKVIISCMLQNTIASYVVSCSKIIYRADILAKALGRNNLGHNVTIFFWICITCVKVAKAQGIASGVLTITINRACPLLLL